MYAHFVTNLDYIMSRAQQLQFCLEFFSCTLIDSFCSLGGAAGVGSTHCDSSPF